MAKKIAPQPVTAVKKRATARSGNAKIPPKTTTIRVDAGTHAALMKMSVETDRSIIDLIRDAVGAMSRQRGREIAARQLMDMRKDPKEWESFERETDLFSYGFFSRE